MAVPAQRERLWGAQSASELALAGIVNFVVSDSCHGDVPTFFNVNTILNAWNYTL